MSKLTIFEGVDGSGKSTAAQDYAAKTGAAYVHLGPFKGELQIAHHYAQAMLPAVRGEHDVVMDRSWLSERPYGNAFRDGADRLGLRRRSLERLAMRAATVVVRCLPPWEAVRANFGQKVEMLERESQLRHVYLAYKALRTSLHTVDYDYTEDRFEDVADFIDGARTLAHPHPRTAGHWHAPTLLVGEAASPPRSEDVADYQWPFGSFSQSGCSLWLAKRLEDACVSEADLLWINAADATDAELQKLARGRRRVIALGAEAGLRVGCDAVLPHPAHWRRFRSSEPYQLGKLLQP